MIFTKELLQEIAYHAKGETVEGVKIVQKTFVTDSRWSLHWNQILEFEDKFYSTTYSVGATEMQDEEPYEYSGYEIECKEVFPHAVTVIEYHDSIHVPD